VNTDHGKQPKTVENRLGSIMKNAFWIIFAILVVLYFIGSNSDKKDASSPIVRNATPAEVIGTTAEQLFQMYDYNEVATDSAIKGKILEVKGTVQSINKDFLDHMYVSLVTPNQFMSAGVRSVLCRSNREVCMSGHTNVFCGCLPITRPCESRGRVMLENTDTRA
jgi:hypothetical protein